MSLKKHHARAAAPIKRISTFSVYLSMILLLNINGKVKAQDIKPTGLKAIFVGGPTVILEIGGLRIMTDPTLDKAGTRFHIRGNNTLEKLAGPALSDVGKIDVVLLSHDQHPDNLDSMGRRLLSASGKVITTKEGAERLKANTIGLSPFQHIRLQTPQGDKIIVTAVPARHGPYGIEKQTGTVTGFLIDVKGVNSFQLYISGDTGYFPGIDKIAKKYKPKYAFIFAGAAQPSGPLNVTMNTNDMVEVARVFPTATIIPLHSEGWSHYTQHNTDYQKVFTALGISARLKVLVPGEKTVL